MDDIFRFSISEEVGMGIRLLLAALLGAVAGYERQHAAKPAGLRTMSLVSLGAAAFTVTPSSGLARVTRRGWPPR